MAHDVFVSYSSKDKAVADAVCATLESNRIRCWIAPRDVPPGLSYPAALSHAIDDCRAMVLVFSSDSNTSPQVIREVERAVSKGKPIVPFRIHDVQPSPDMGYLIGTLHWLDALTPPLEAHLRQLVVTVQSFLTSQSADSSQPVQVPRIAQPTKWSRTLQRGTTRVLSGVGVLFVAIILLRAAGLNVYYYPNRGNAWEIRWGPPPTAVTQDTPPAPGVVAPTLISMVNTPVGVPTSPVLPMSTATPAVTNTPRPTPTAIPADKILLQERFDDPKYDGSLPLSLDRSCINGLEAQQNGALVIVPIDETFCSLNLKVQQPRPDQFRLFQTRFMYKGTDRTSMPVVSIGFGMRNPMPEEFLDTGAMISPPTISFAVADHTKPAPYYNSPFINISADTWYTLAMILNNPDTLEFSFELNGVKAGSYSLAERAALWRSNTMYLNIGHGLQPKTAPTVYLDDLLIVAR